MKIQNSDPRVSNGVHILTGKSLLPFSSTGLKNGTNNIKAPVKLPNTLHEIVRILKKIC